MTYSIVAFDPATGELGAAVQSRWFSVGSSVPWVEPGVGAVATQSFTEVGHGPNGLRLMREGRRPPRRSPQVLASDPGEAMRQVGMVDASGTRPRTPGPRCVRYASHLVGDGVAVQANMMERSTVPAAMLAAYRGDRRRPRGAAPRGAGRRRGRGRRRARTPVRGPASWHPGRATGRRRSRGRGASTCGSRTSRCAGRRAGPGPVGGARLRGDGRGRGGGRPWRRGGRRGGERAVEGIGARRRPDPAVARRRPGAGGTPRRGARRARPGDRRSSRVPASTCAGSPSRATSRAATPSCRPSASSDGGRRTRRGANGCDRPPRGWEGDGRSQSRRRLVFDCSSVVYSVVLQLFDRFGSRGLRPCTACVQ